MHARVRERTRGRTLYSRKKSCTLMPPMSLKAAGAEAVAGAPAPSAACGAADMTAGAASSTHRCEPLLPQCQLLLFRRADAVRERRPLRGRAAAAAPSPQAVARAGGHCEARRRSPRPKAAPSRGGCCLQWRPCHVRWARTARALAPCKARGAGATSKPFLPKDGSERHFVRRLGIRISYPEGARVPAAVLTRSWKTLSLIPGFPTPPTRSRASQGTAAAANANQRSVVRRRCWRWPASGVCPSGRQRR